MSESRSAAATGVGQRIRARDEAGEGQKRQRKQDKQDDTSEQRKASPRGRGRGRGRGGRRFAAPIAAVAIASESLNNFVKTCHTRIYSTHQTAAGKQGAARRIPECAGSGSPRPRFARPASRSPESAQGANSPNAPARARRVPAPHGATGKAFFRPSVRIRAGSELPGKNGRVIHQIHNSPIFR